MQRQSLGSPGRTATAAGISDSNDVSPDIDEIKTVKLSRPTTSSRTITTVHLIPVLTLLCFLILYLFSHEPSPKDLPTIRGMERLLDPKGGAVSGIGRYLVNTGSVSGNRLLKEEKKLRSRKLGIP